MEQQPTVSVRQAEAPRSGEWVVEWRSPLIAGPSYLYFATREQAEEAAKRISEQGTAGSPSYSGTSEPQVPWEARETPPAREVLQAGRRLLKELPEGTCPDAAAALESALQRLEDEVRC